MATAVVDRLAARQSGCETAGDVPMQLAAIRAAEESVARREKVHAVADNGSPNGGQ